MAVTWLTAEVGVFVEWFSFCTDKIVDTKGCRCYGVRMTTTDLPVNFRPDVLGFRETILSLGEAMQELMVLWATYSPDVPLMRIGQI